MKTENIIQLTESFMNRALDGLNELKEKFSQLEMNQQTFTKEQVIQIVKIALQNREENLQEALNEINWESKYIVKDFIELSLEGCNNEIKIEIDSAELTSIISNEISIDVDTDSVETEVNLIIQELNSNK